MRIAYFTDTYKPQINGVVRSIEGFEEELRKRGHEVFVFYPMTRKYVEDKYHIPVPSFTFPPYPEFRASIISFRLFNRTRKIKPDIIHVQTPASIGAGGLIVAKMLNIPTVAHYHTLLPEYFSYFLGKLQKSRTVIKYSTKIMWKYTKYFYNRADAIIVPTQAVKDMLKRYGIHRPIYVIPNIIRGKKLRKIPHKGINILHVGRLCKEKSIDIVIKEFAKIERPGINLILTSDGPDRKRLERLVETLGLKNVTFTGYISENRLKRLYQLSDIFVSASKTETFGMVIAEAFKAGVPVVVFPALGFRDIVIDKYNGIFVKKNSDISAAIEKLIGDKKLRQRLSAGAYKSMEQYCEKKLTDELIKVYTSVITRH